MVWKAALVVVAFAGILLALPKGWEGKWVSPRDSNDQVVLTLKTGGKFEGSENVLAETKPGPHYKMRGSWSAKGHTVVLSSITYTGRGYPAGTEIVLPASSGSLTWPFSKMKLSK
jgi:hypothetical protein